MKPAFILFFLAGTAWAQVPEADLWRCGLPRLAPQDRIAACTGGMTVAPEDAAPWHNRGVAYMQLKQYREAVLDFTQALRRAKEAQTHTFRGHAFAELGEYERAFLDLEEAVRMAPKDAHAHNALAWVLATAGTPGFRDGKRAVELARKANELSRWNDPAHLDTLAAAYAEAGNFKEAVQWQEKALAHPAFASKEDLKEGKERLALYKARKAYRKIPGF
ncbi:MAG TPA: tetratricopeptide repeat protein [Burkholderiales bacterium]|nr:tetratricopeptide repeat protein [Burkholderiales bacterium]